MVLTPFSFISVRLLIGTDSVYRLTGDDKISIKEFKEGILSLQGMLENKFTESEVDALVRHIDMNNDGHISYSEFFASFQLVDPKLAERQVHSTHSFLPCHYHFLSPLIGCW